MSVLKLLGLDVRKINRLADETCDLVEQVKKLLPPLHALVAKGHQIADIALEEDDEA